MKTVNTRFPASLSLKLHRATKKLKRAEPGGRWVVLDFMIDHCMADKKFIDFFTKR